MIQAETKNTIFHEMPKWRGIGLFCVGFFLLMTVLTAFVIIPQINSAFEESLEVESKDKLALEAELFERFISSQQKILADAASYPSLTNAVLLASADNPSFIDYFNNIRIGGKQSPLVLQDLEGSIMLQKGALQGNYASEENWARDLLAGSIHYHFQLLDQKEDALTFKMSVPVVYNSYIEGILSAEITTSLEEIFIIKNDSKLAFKLSQDNVIIKTNTSHINIPKESTLQLKQPQITFTLITDESLSKQKAEEIQNTILTVLLLGLLISFILFVILEYKTYVLSSSHNQKSFSASTRTYIMPIFVGVVGLATSITAFIMLMHIEKIEKEAEFYATSKAFIQSLKERLKDNSDALSSLKAFYDASTFVDRKEFKEFTLPLLKNHPDIQALEWVPHVPHTKRAEYEKRARDEGFDGFTFIDKDEEGNLIPAPIQETYYPVYYLEPFESNKIVFGLAPSYHKERRQAIYKARDTGKAVATNPISLTQDKQRKAAYLVFSPVYEGASSYAKIDERREHSKGYVLLVLLTENVIANTLKNGAFQDLKLHIQDITLSQQGDTIYGSKIDDSNTKIFNDSIDFEGRRWNITTASSFFTNVWQIVPLFTLIGGILFTTFVVLGLLHLIRRHEIVEALVKERTAELKMINNLVANSNDIFMITEAGEINADKGGPKIIYVNDAFLRMTGFKQEEVIGNTPRILQGEHTDKEELQKIRHAIEKGETYRGELINYTKDGKEYWIDVTIWPLKDEAGNIFQFGSVERDITALKQIEQKRLELQQAMQLAVEGISKIDTKGRYVYVNDAYAQAIGYTPEELIGKTWDITVVDEQLKTMEDAYQQMLKDGKVVAETIGQCKDGSTLHKLVTMISDHNEKGEFVGHFCFMKDISERKQAELERETLIDKLAVSNEELERFAYVASHDLKAPLRGIDNLSQWIEEDISTVISEETQENLDLMRKRVKRMESLLDDLLEYSRIERKIEKASPDLITVSEIMEEVIHLVSAPEGFNITFNKAFETIYAPRMPLQQVVFNLVSNAMKHHDQKHGHIHVSVIDLGTQYRFSVSDDGPGIAKEFHKKIFEMFQTLQPRDKVEGSGMGLALVQKTVTTMGGTIHLESETNKGSAFSFTWPKYQPIEQEKHTA